MPQNPALLEEVNSLKTKLANSHIPPELNRKAQDMILRLTRIAQYSGYSSEYDRTAHYIDWITSLPWYTKTTDHLNLSVAKQVMEKHHYGMDQVKERVLEYLSTMKLNQQKNENIHAPILCLVGLVGTGKTTFAYSLSEALERNLARIPFGGLGSAKDLRGQSRLHLESEPGLVIKAVRRAGSNNPVFLLDEIDRVTQEARSDIMGVLVELLDPEQNHAFVDHYIDYPFDLSKALFIVTANNTRNIATAVLDRVEVIQMPSYTDEEKITIGQKYLLPRALKEAGLTAENLSFDDQVWPKIVRPLGFDAGMRTLERTIKSICRKIAKLIVEGQKQHFHLDMQNIKNYLPTY